MIRKEKNTGLFQAPFFHVKSTPSVLDEAKSLLEKEKSHVGHGTVISTEYQTKGRGQQGSKWMATPKSSLLIAVLLHKDRIVTDRNAAAFFSGLITVSVANALSKTIRALFTEQHLTHHSKNIRIKWPNDVLISHKKVSGILIESYANWIVVGVGCNVLRTAVDELTIPKESLIIPTTLETWGITTTINTVYKKFSVLLEQEIQLSTEEKIAWTNTILWKKNEEVLFDPRNTQDPFLATIRHVNKKAALVVDSIKKSHQAFYNGKILQ